MNLENMEKAIDLFDKLKVLKHRLSLCTDNGYGLCFKCVDSNVCYSIEGGEDFIKPIRNFLVDKIYKVEKEIEEL